MADPSRVQPNREWPDLCSNESSLFAKHVHVLTELANIHRLWTPPRTKFAMIHKEWNAWSWSNEVRICCGLCRSFLSRWKLSHREGRVPRCINESTMEADIMLPFFGFRASKMQCSGDVEFVFCRVDHLFIQIAVPRTVSNASYPDAKVERNLVDM